MMDPIAPVLTTLNARIADLTDQFGRRVDIARMNITSREGQLPLAVPSAISPNGACRLIAAADGWIAVNLAREEDRELIPAWLCEDVQDDVWNVIESVVPARNCDALLAHANLLGLPVARVGEIAACALEAPLRRMTRGAHRVNKELAVVDLSALWAGPMCGAVLAQMGASVVKIESFTRPDLTRDSTPEFFHRLNGQKSELWLDFSEAADRARLREVIVAADVLITSARPRVFSGLGLFPEEIFTANPGLVWVAITGYGWTGKAAMRVAFGDDASAAGGLLRWTKDGAPEFLGDALADPVTGLMAAVGALDGLTSGGGVLVDVAMASSAAGAATALGMQKAE